jgi:protein-disulfide isomerase
MVTKRIFASFVFISALSLAACQSGNGQQKSTPPASGAAAAGESRVDPNKVVLSWSGGQMTYGELYTKHAADFKKLKSKYDSEVYDTELQNLEGFVIQTLVEAEAKKAGKTPEEYVQGLAEGATVTDADVKAFYEGDPRAKGQPFEMIAPQIKSYLEGTKKQEVVRAEFERLKKQANVKIDLPEPSGATFDLAGRPMIGSPDAKVTIVAFSDFECPYCSQAAPKMHDIVKAYPKDVKLYFLHYPLSFHKAAMPAAVAAHCANQQGKFWEMHDKMFANQQGLTEDLFKSTAKELGLDESKFVACLGDAATKDFVNKDMEQGNTAGVEGTPSVFINGKHYPKGVPTVDAVKEYVDRVN